MTTFIPTPEHEDIFNAVAFGQSNLLIEAVAGAGKTTTLLELLRVLPVDPSSILPPATTFLAFNKDIAETLKARVPRHVSCSTFHSLGLRALRRAVPTITVDSQKVPKLLYSRLGRDHDDFENCRKLVSLLKCQPPKEDRREHHDAQELCDLYDISFQEHGSMRAVLDVFCKSISDLSSCDFDDMLFLPVLLNAEFDQQDYVLCDEAQDTNEIQLEILERLAKPQRPLLNSDVCDNEGWMTLPSSPTRFFFVGDSKQAIYGFRGANTDSLSKVRQRFNCICLPLSITYRCSKAVVSEVQKYL